jgi:hypothetical protein
VVALANTIRTAMTGNANFATPNPSLASVGTQVTTTSTKIAAYDTLVASGQTALADRDAAVATLCGLLSQLGAYVENTSGGDAVKIQSAGMGVRAASAPVGPVAQVLDLVLSAGDFDGTLDLMCAPVRGAKSYEIQTSPDPQTNTSWTPKMTASKSSATIEGLTSGAKVWVRMRAIGAENKPGPWSDPAVKVVP